MRSNGRCGARTGTLDSGITPRFMTEQLAAVLTTSSDPGLDELADVVGVLRTSVALADALRGVAADPAALDRMAARSSWHPLGFAKIHLGAPAGSWVQLRLHVWVTPREDVMPEDDPHAHRWRFASSVLWGGALRVVHFEESSSGEEYHRFRYGSGGDGLTRDDRCRLAVARELTRLPSETYRCERDTVHTIQPVDRGRVTTTLIARGPDAEESTPVYRRRNDPTISDRSRLTADELHDVLDRAVPRGRSTTWPVSPRPPADGS